MPSTRRPPANKDGTPLKRGKRKPKPKLSKLKGLPLGHAGRPPIYDVGLNERVTKLALLGQTDEEIARFINISGDTFYAWVKKHRAFSEALADGRLNADANVAASLYNRATGKTKIPAVKVAFDGDGNPLYAPYVQHFPPDVGAAKLWLLNRRPKDWRERKELEVTGTIEHRLAAMSPEERRARLIELQAKAALVIDGEASEIEE